MVNIRKVYKTFLFLLQRHLETVVIPYSQLVMVSTSPDTMPLEIRQNGDIYFPDTDNTTYQNYYEKPMVRLQDMYAALGGLKLVKLTQSEYDALPTKDANTLYIISNVVS